MNTQHDGCRSSLTLPVLALWWVFLDIDVAFMLQWVVGYGRALTMMDVEGFYIVSYGLGIYILNLLIGFLSPKVDPELEVLDGASLPTKESDKFKPFIHRLPKFKFWYAISRAFYVAYLMTFSIFDVPVFWPKLLCYWVLELKRIPIGFASTSVMLPKVIVIMGTTGEE
ncbi:Retrieval of early ER protein Rer1 [Dillenia turbinata]|uniref:Retrieval of early ER protein Rer1 n=1 Tax=Dillenia turbinata TaxID=194707 RepID=A0AAN8Z7T7_9MAGN